MNNSESSSATVPKTPLAEQNGPVEQMIEKNVDESELQFGESAHPAGDNSIAVAGRNHVKTSNFYKLILYDCELFKEFEMLWCCRSRAWHT